MRSLKMIFRSRRPEDNVWVDERAVQVTGNPDDPVTLHPLVKFPAQDTTKKRMASVRWLVSKIFPSAKEKHCADSDQKDR